GGGTFGAVTVSTQTMNQSRGVAWGDFDKDGDLDLLAGFYNGALSYVTVFRYDGANTFVKSWWHQGTSEYNTSVSWMDYDNDGWLDIVVAQDMANQVRVYRNKRDGSFAEVSMGVIGVLGINGNSVQAGDYDNDGDLDLLFGNYNNIQGPIIRRNDGDAANPRYVTSWNSAVAEPVRQAQWGDIDNDGDLDFALAKYNVPIEVYQNQGGSFAMIWQSTISEPTYSVAWGDYDKDGYMDLAVGNYGAANRIYRNAGNRTFLPVWQATATYNTRYVAWADVDNDGDLDLSVASYGGSKIVYKSNVAYYEGTNNKPFAPSSGFFSTYDGGSNRVRMRWDDGADTETPAKGLYYNVQASSQTPVQDWNANLLPWRQASPFFGAYPHGFAVAVSTQPGMDWKPFVEGTSVYWRVQTVDAGFSTSPWSSEYSTYVPNVPPTAPDLVSPLDGFTTNVMTINFDWTDSTDTISGVAGYEFQHSTDAVFDVNDGTETLSFSVFQATDVPAETVYWRVRAFDKAGNYGDWSGYRMCTRTPIEFRWVGPDFGYASSSVNWSPQGIPDNNDSVGFYPSSNTYCYWDLWDVELSSLTIYSGYTSTVNVMTAGNTITLKEDFSQASGGMYTASAGFTLRVGGDFLVSGGTVTTGPSDGGEVRFIDSATHNYNAPGVSLGNLFVSSGTVTLQSDLYLKGNLNISSGTLSAGNHLIRVGHNWNQDATGGFDAGTSTVQFRRTDNAFSHSINLPAGTSFYNLDVRTYSTVYVYMSSPVVVLGDLSISSGNLSSNGYTTTLHGNVYRSSNTYWGVSTSSVVFAGAADQSVTTDGGGTFDFYRVEVNKSPGSRVTLSAPASFNGGLTLSGGIFDSGSSSHTLWGSIFSTQGNMDNQDSTWTLKGSNYQVLPSTVAWGTLVIDKYDAAIPATVTFTMDGATPTINNLYVPYNSGGAATGLDISTNQAVSYVRIAGDLIVENTTHFRIEGSTIEFTGPGESVIKSNGYGQVKAGNIIIDKTGGWSLWGSLGIDGNLVIENVNGFYLGDASCVTTLSGSFLKNGGGVFSLAGGTIAFSGDTTHYLKLAASDALSRVDVNGGVLALMSTATVNDDFNWNGGNIDLYSAATPDADLYVGGDWMQGCSAAGFYAGDGRTILNGTKEQILTGSCGPAYMGNLVIRSTVTSNGAMIAEDFSLELGTYNATTFWYNQFVRGDFSQSPGTYFVSGNSTFYFNGDAPQVIALQPGSSFYNFVSSGALVSAGSDLNIVGEFSLASGTFDTNGATVTLSRHMNYTNGAFDGTGLWVFNGANLVDQSVYVSTFDNVRVDKADGWALYFWNGLDADGDVLFSTNSIVDFDMHASTFRGDFIAYGTMTDLPGARFVGGVPAAIHTSSSTSAFQDLTISKDSGVSVTATSPLWVAGSFYVQNGVFNAGDGLFAIKNDFIGSGGTFNPNNGTVRLEGYETGGNTVVQLPAGSSFNFLIVEKEVMSTMSHTVYFNSAIDAGYLYVNNTMPTGFLTLSPNDYAHTLSGDFYLGGSGSDVQMTSGDFTFDGIGTQHVGRLNGTTTLQMSTFTVAGSSVAAISPIRVDNVWELSSGEFVPGTFTHLVNGAFYAASGVGFDPSTGTFQFMDSAYVGALRYVQLGDAFQHFSNFEVNAASVVAQSDLNIRGTLDMEAGGGDPDSRFNPNGHQVNLGGDLKAYDGNSLVPSGTFYFDGGTVQAISNSMGADATLNHLVID
ncbi:MAG TPA: VCBS repeat-containing protein, partial [Elusimicrobiota bacterium]|nr:VCBS repeat-containing protein [Elusimicrobiota bacterium]